MRVFRVFTVVALFYIIPLISFASGNILREVQIFMKQKEYNSAKKVLLQGLKKDENSYRLWLALGYIYEAEDNSKRALMAFRKAGSLRMGIAGLERRIIRLERLLLNVKEDNPKLVSSSHKKLEESKYYYFLGKKEEAYQLFSTAVEGDRLLLSEDFGIISEALQYYKENANIGENLFFLGAYSFYSGYYTEAQRYLATYILDGSNDHYISYAKKMIAESEDVIAQQKLVKINLERNTERTNGINEVKSKKQETKKPKSIDSSNKSRSGLSSVNNLDASEESEPMDIDPANSRDALALVESFNSKKQNDQYRIILRLKNLGDSSPEVLNLLSRCLQSDDIDMVMISLEAVDKIGESAVKSLEPIIIDLFHSEDRRAVYYSIEFISKNPIAPTQLVPRLINIYVDGSRFERKVASKAVFGYGKSIITLLKQELIASDGDRKFAVAELIGGLTGKTPEQVIEEVD